MCRTKSNKQSCSLVSRSIGVVSVVLVCAISGSGLAANPLNSGTHTDHKMMHQGDDSSPLEKTIEPLALNADPHAQHKKQMQKIDLYSIDIDLPAGLALQNQFGESVDLIQDVIGDRIAVINFVYTTCTTVCPVVSSIFTQVQDQLGNKMSREIALITISVDPARDTSHRLLSYSKKFNSGKGWSWLTGDKKMVDRVNRILGAYTPSFEDHPAMVLVGDLKSSNWYRYIGFPPPADITKKVHELLSNRKS